MAYTKPQIIAQNATSGSYAAGCPTRDQRSPGGASSCVQCERTR